MTAHLMAFSPLERSTLASVLSERLREGIADGTLEPGVLLSEVELATRFGVSRGPVREALQRLIQEGLVRSEPHRGVFVPVLSEDDVRDIYLARHALETSAVQQIIDIGRGEQAAEELDQLVKLMADSAAADDWESVGRYDLEFHTALVAATGSERLQRMFGPVIFESRLCLATHTPADARIGLAATHRQITACIRERKAAEALALLKQHFEDAIVTIKSRARGSQEERG